MLRSCRSRVCLCLLVLSGLLVCATAAQARVVAYRGARLTIPASWPVIRLGARSTACVRFDRHALYLGVPGTAQRCPTHAIGHTEAILAEPQGAIRSLRAAGTTTAVLAGGRVRVTATWGRNPGLIRRALGLRSLPSATVTPRVVRRNAARAGTGGTGLGGGGTVPASTYTGLGFDACAAPSSAAMTAWGASPYRAVGIYVGGANMACSQSNLTATWVAAEAAAGWHLIPTYVGLQAPGACGCASLDTNNPVPQAQAAAADAIANMQALGLGPGNPIYYDMEAYNGNSSAVLTYLSAWTAALHAAGYLSGVYSSANSGIADLASQYGTTYLEPDELWIARWNNTQDTVDPNVAATEWATHQRIHQYSGGTNVTYGRAKLNIDGDYVDAATAGNPTAPVIAPAPSLTVRPAADGSINLSASWTGVSNIATWELLAGDDPSTMAPLAAVASSGAATPITTHSAYDYFAVQALDAGAQQLGVSQAVATPAHLAIFGRTAYVPKRGLAGVPAGCFTGTSCRVTLTATAGRTVIATTGPERIGADSGGIVFFKPTAAGRAKLAAARAGRLAVNVALSDASGARVSTSMTLISYTTSGRAPRRTAHNDPALRFIGGTDFAARDGTGGILAGCAITAPCSVSTTIRVGRVTVAKTGSEFLGAGALGYMIFRLTAQGRSLLAHAAGNQLGAHVVLRSGSATANADIVLVGAG
jgi:hypothetical protein